VQGRDERIDEALQKSFLCVVADRSRERLLRGAISLDVPPGSILYRDADEPRLGLVVAGLVRVFMTSANARQITVRYARPGAVLGTAMAVGGPVDLSVQAVTGTSLLMLDVEGLRTLAKTDPDLAWRVAEEVTERLYEVLEAFAGSAFGTVRQRVARHLLDLATARGSGAMLLAPISQQGLADAVGTAREVVARTLHDLRLAGLVETERNGIRLLDPDRLSDVATGGML
jgi:CRP/FNR family cyclic AMP-dependent transcriptional regulator